MYNSNLGNKIERGKKDGVSFQKDYERKYQRERTNVDCFERITKEVVWIWAGEPVFSFSCENIDHSVLKFDNAFLCFITKSSNTSERVTENRNKIQDEGNLG
jgi:hypothetical protein